VIRCSEELDIYVRADLAARGLPGTWRREYRETQPPAYYQWLLRRCEYVTNCRPDIVGRAWSRILRYRLDRLGRALGFDVPLNVFGPGLVLHRPAAVRVHPGVRVGSHCSIAGDVVMSAGPAGCPTIGDDVSIGSGARIVGNVSVGNDVTVLPHSSVVDSAPAGAVLSGSPARVVSHDLRYGAGAASLLRS
jgi:serine O-acetyltransferase